MTKIKFSLYSFKKEMFRGQNKTMSIQIQRLAFTIKMKAFYAFKFTSIEKASYSDFDFYITKVI